MYAIWRYKTVNIGSSDGFLPDGTKPLAESMLINQTGHAKRLW